MMQRRQMMKTVAAGAALTATPAMSQDGNGKEKFKLGYAPHPGMFKASAGDDIIDQITEGNLIPNIDACWSEIAYFQSGDNPGRKEPYTGEINYRNVFAHIHSKGYTGVIGMEHGNSQKAAGGERQVIDAYRRADDF